MLRRLIVQLGAVFHWQPSEIKQLSLDEAVDYMEKAGQMKLLLNGS